MLFTLTLFGICLSFLSAALLFFLIHGTHGTNAGGWKYRKTRCNIHFKLEVFILYNKFLMLFYHLKFNQLKRLKTVKQSQIISSILNGIMNFYRMYAVLWHHSHSAFGVPNFDGFAWCQTYEILIVEIILLLYFCEMLEKLATNHIYRGCTLWHTIPLWSSALRKTKNRLSILGTHLHPTLQLREESAEAKWVKLIYLIHMEETRTSGNVVTEMEFPENVLSFCLTPNHCH